MWENVRSSYQYSLIDPSDDWGRVLVNVVVKLFLMPFITNVLREREREKDGERQRTNSKPNDKNLTFPIQKIPRFLPTFSTIGKNISKRDDLEI